MKPNIFLSGLLCLTVLTGYSQTFPYQDPSLSPQERAAFLMRHYQGCSIEEICGALDLRTNAAKHSIFRAVRKMRDALRPLMEVAAAGSVTTRETL